MKKYKDNFESQAESLEKGEEGTIIANTNKETRQNITSTHNNTSVQPAKASSISPIRTLADDLAHSVKDDNLTLSQQALKNSSTPHKETPDRGPETNHKAHLYRKKQKNKGGHRLSKSFLFLILSFIIFGGSLLLFVSRQEVTLGNVKVSLPTFKSLSGIQDNEIEMSVSFPETLVKVDNQKELFIDLSTERTALKEVLNKESQLTQAGALTALFPAEIIEAEGRTELRFTDISSLFEITDISIQSVLSRNIETYTFGVSGRGDARAFLVANVYSYEEVFGKLLEWEEIMPRELYGFFHENLSFALGENFPSFADTVVSGHDSRVLSDANEKDVLIYSLINNRTLVITHSREELARIISRLQ